MRSHIIQDSTQQCNIQKDLLTTDINQKIPEKRMQIMYNKCIRKVNHNYYIQYENDWLIIVCTANDNIDIETKKFYSWKLSLDKQNAGFIYYIFS